jgi:tRNA uridine 5-carboxymethylaminomethyl modification enzyme
LATDQAETTRSRLEQTATARDALAQRAVGSAVGLDDVRTLPMVEWVRRGEVEQRLRDLHANDAAMQEAIDDAVYAPYLERQQHEVAARERDRLIAIDRDFRFETVPGLSSEMVERFGLVRPATIVEASRIAGVTPAALAALHFALLRRAA